MQTDLNSFPLGNRDKILVCPLNWGLGHATRCVPIIRKLMDEGRNPVVASDGYPLRFLQQEFPSLRFIELPSYPIRYATGTSQVGAMLRCLPGILRGIISEHYFLKKIIKAEQFEQVISDNRFGMWNRKVHSVYITHQLMVKMPRGIKFMEPVVWLLHRIIIHRFDICLIPDYAKNGLSGDLSHKYPLPENATFITPLSRFQNATNIQPDRRWDVVAIVSGVEPQRTMFEEKIMERYRKGEDRVLIICGRPGDEQLSRKIGNITLVPHIGTTEMAAALLGAKKIICRSGYSSIMDLAVLGCLKKAEFIPTPGQTEQEYLFSIHSHNKS